MRTLWTYCLLQCLVAGALWAQGGNIAAGAGKPTQHEPWLDFYLDTLHHQAYFHHQGVGGAPTWSEVGDSTTLALDACNSLSVLFDGERYKVYLDAYLLDDIVVTHYRCMADRIWVWNALKVTAYDAAGAEPEDLYCKMPRHCWGTVPMVDSVQGQVAFCFAPPELNFKSFYCGELVSWGMIGLDGKWLIAPKFDQPFHFKNGIAYVIYYGQKRKINEKGEFVE